MNKRADIEILDAEGDGSVQRYPTSVPKKQKRSELVTPPVAAELGAKIHRALASYVCREVDVPPELRGIDVNNFCLLRDDGRRTTVIMSSLCDEVMNDMVDWRHLVNAYVIPDKALYSFHDWLLEVAQVTKAPGCVMNLLEIFFHGLTHYLPENICAESDARDDYDAMDLKNHGVDEHEWFEYSASMNGRYSEFKINIREVTASLVNISKTYILDNSPK